MPYTTTLPDAVRKLIPEEHKRKRMAAAPARTNIAAAMGVGKPEQAGTGTGIEWPLTEIAGTRVFHDHDLKTSDGIFVFEDFINQTIQMVDAVGEQGSFIYDDPYNNPE